MAAVEVQIGWASAKHLVPGKLRRTAAKGERVERSRGIRSSGV